MSQSDGRPKRRKGPKASQASPYLQSLLVKDVVTAALQDLKQQTEGQFGMSKLEAKLDACLPALATSIANITRWVRLSLLVALSWCVLNFVAGDGWCWLGLIQLNLL